MERFKKILVVLNPLGDNEPILGRAVELALKNQAQVTLLEVVNDLGAELQWLRTRVDAEQLQQTIIEDHLQSLEKMIEPFRKKGARIKPKILVGNSFLEIVREVLQGKHDLLMKSASGKSPIRTMLFGSTDMHLFRKCPIPVWIFKPTTRKKIGRILAAVDPHPHDKDRTDLSLKIVKLATSLARGEGSELHIVHAMIPFTEKVLRSSRSGFRSDMVDRLLKEIEGEQNNAVLNLIDDYSFKGVAYQRHMVKGEPGEAIPKLAKEKQVDLIVMGTVGRTGIEGFFMGNTAEKTLQQVECSVLAVKPDGYRSPIQVEETN